MLEPLAQLRRLGYRVTLDGDTVLCRYVGPTEPRPELVRPVLAALRLNEEAIVAALRREAASGWPPGSFEAEARFGCPEARLYPFLNRRIETPEGPGRLLQVLAPEAEVLLDHDPERTRRFPFDLVRPPRRGRKEEDREAS